MDFESFLECEEETGLELFVRLGADGFSLKTKLESLNEVVSLESGKIYEIDGDLSSGKSQICYSICAKFLETRKSAKILWISAVALRTDMLIKHLDMKTNELGRIICNSPENIDQLVKQLDWARNSQKSLDFRLLFVENIDALLHDTAYQINDLGKTHQFGVMNRLNKISKLGVTVVITNHITKWRGYPAPALGNFWADQINYRFFVEKKEQMNCYVVSTMKSGQPTEMPFKITDQGLQNC